MLDADRHNVKSGKRLLQTRSARFVLVAVVAFFVLTILACRHEAQEEPSESGRFGSQPMLELTDANFQAEVLDSPQPVVVVDAWAAWCRPCLEMKPVIQKVAAHFVGQARVGELNIDANRFTAEKYEIQTLPTILIFRDGVIVKRLEGQHTKGELIKAIDAIIAASQ